MPVPADLTRSRRPSVCFRPTSVPGLRGRLPPLLPILLPLQLPGLSISGLGLSHRFCSLSPQIPDFWLLAPAFAAISLWSPSSRPRLAFSPRSRLATPGALSFLRCSAAGGCPFTVSGMYNFDIIKSPIHSVIHKCVSSRTKSP